MGLFSMNDFSFSQRLLSWHDQHGRTDLPWQQDPTPYRVWLSEIMLQQTQVSTVIPYYHRFINRFPDNSSLAAASQDEVLSLWTGLGYYARARNLHRCAQLVAEQHQGQLPANLEALIALPGIGRSTAGAIMALAYHQTFPILDGNVKRVLARFYATDSWPGIKATEQILWQHAESLLPKKRIAAYIQAQMDLGATLCTRSKPNCDNCPLQSNCQAYAQGTPAAYPIPKPKKPIPTRQTYWLILRSEKGQVLLSQRPEKGIWGGLWCFPSFDDAISLEQYMQTIDATKLTDAQPRNFRHIFTHFKLDIHPYLYQSKQSLLENIPDNMIWYKIEDALLLGLPAPVKKTLLTLH